MRITKPLSDFSGKAMFYGKHDLKQPITFFEKPVGWSLFIIITWLCTSAPPPPLRHPSKMRARVRNFREKSAGEGQKFRFWRRVYARKNSRTGWGLKNLGLVVLSFWEVILVGESAPLYIPCLLCQRHFTSQLKIITFEADW